jgi:protein TonB
MWAPNGTAILFRDEAQHRALLACVGVSIALHALVLFAFPGFRPSAHAESLSVLSASFASRPAPSEPAPPVERLTPKPPEPPREREPEKPLPVLARPEPAAPMAAQPAPTPLRVPSPPEVAPMAAAADMSRAVEAPAAEHVANPSVETFDPALLKAYQLALRDAAKRYERYPVQALERGWEGRVEIRVVIGPNGMIKNALVRISSRYQILDDQALDMVRKGKSMTPIPAALRGREFTIDIPVNFILTG